MFYIALLRWSDMRFIYIISLNQPKDAGMIEVRLGRITRARIMGKHIRTAHLIGYLTEEHTFLIAAGFERETFKQRWLRCT